MRATRRPRRRPVSRYHRSPRLPALPLLLSLTRSVSENSSSVCVNSLESNGSVCKVVSHGQDLQNLSSGARFAVTAKPSSVVAGESPGLLCVGRGGPVGPFGDRVGV